MRQGDPTFTRWRSLVPPPPPPAAVPWPAVEAACGTALPSDYRDYVDTYGVGVVGDLYWVLHPLGPPNPHLRAAWVEERRPEAARTFRTPPPYPLGDVAGGLLPCALDEDAGVLYWHASHHDPDRWTMVLRDEDADSWISLPMRLVEYLLALFERRLPQVGFDAAGYTDAQPTFRPQ